MSYPTRTTKRNLGERLIALVDLLRDDPKAFDVMCEILMDQDFFGTEGQNDPRGDHR